LLFSVFLCVLCASVLRFRGLRGLEVLEV